MQTPADLQDSLRVKTAYPILRFVLVISAIIDAICAIGFFAAIFFDSGHTEILIVASAGSLAGLVPIFLGIALLDIADAAIRKMSPVESQN